MTASGIDDELPGMRKEIRKAWRAFRTGGAALTKSEAGVVDAFHRLYYETEDGAGTWKNMRWLGVDILKCPMDLWIYQELLFELRPDVILETGTAYGGSAFYLATLCDILKHGRIITVDIEARENRPVHPRVEYVTGSSASPEIIARLRKQIRPTDKVMAFLDSDHHKPHVLAELRAYAELVTPGGYLVVEDSNVNGHPVALDYGPGPMEAMEEFLAENKNFTVDKSREKFFMTFNPRGYLKRVK